MEVKTMRMKSLIASLFGAGLILAFSLTAQAADWWPFSVIPDGPDKTPIQYVPLEKASKKWNLCVLIPDLTDSYWVANNYGTVEEAKRLGVRA
jgi:protein TorT